MIPRKVKKKKVFYFFQGKQLVYFDHQNVNYHCSRHHLIRQQLVSASSVFLSSLSINLPAFYHECRSLIDYATYYLFCFIIKFPNNARSDWLKERAFSENRARADDGKLAFKFLHYYTLVQIYQRSITNAVL